MAVVAAGLLRLGDARGLPFLEEIARRGQGAWSVTAVAWICSHDSKSGLELMLRLLEHGDDEAKQAATTQVWNWARTANPYTEEGRKEARAWIKEQLALKASQHDKAGTSGTVQSQDRSNGAVEA